VLAVQPPQNFGVEVEVEADRQDRFESRDCDSRRSILFQGVAYLEYA